MNQVNCVFEFMFLTRLLIMSSKVGISLSDGGFRRYVYHLSFKAKLKLFSLSKGKKMYPINDEILNMILCRYIIVFGIITSFISKPTKLFIAQSLLIIISIFTFFFYLSFVYIILVALVSQLSFHHP